MTTSYVSVGTVARVLMTLIQPGEADTLVASREKCHLSLLPIGTYLLELVKAPETVRHEWTERYYIGPFHLDPLLKFKSRNSGFQIIFEFGYTRKEVSESDRL